MSLEVHCVLSIDLGIENLGYTVLRYYPGIISLERSNIEFGIWCCTEKIKGRESVVVSRCRRLNEFFKAVGSLHVIDHVIIERQVSKNTMAMELMYATVAIAQNYTNSIHIFDPKEKFVTLRVSYSTNNKAHKKQSIRYAYNIINKWWNDKLVQFETHKKKDDIADSLNQALVWLASNNMLNETLEDIRKISLINEVSDQATDLVQ